MRVYHIEFTEEYLIHSYKHTYTQSREVDSYQPPQRRATNVVNLQLLQLERAPVSVYVVSLLSPLFRPTCSHTHTHRTTTSRRTIAAVEGWPTQNYHITYQPSLCASVRNFAGITRRAECASTSVRVCYLIHSIY